MLRTNGGGEMGWQSMRTYRHREVRGRERLHRYSPVNSPQPDRRGCSNVMLRPINPPEALRPAVANTRTRAGSHLRMHRRECGQ